MTQNKPQTEQDPEVVIESAISRIEVFIMKNGRALLTALVVVIVVVAGFFGYKYLIVAPRAEKAAAEMYVAEQLFAIDSFQQALNGDGNDAGFLQVIDKYGSTAEGNLAKHYAGICYLRMGQFQEALDILKSFSGSDDDVPSAMLTAQNFGLQGDALVQLGNNKDAVALYEKAANTCKDPLTAPYYLKKAGQVYEKLGDFAKALTAYQIIEIDYASSMEARDIQKYIGRLQQQ